jgi:hypothetical protein
MKKDKRLNHAKHNQELCIKIYEANTHHDWVITTAFYSALHFVSYGIFPINEETSDGKHFTIKTLDEYWSYHQLSKSKHKVLSDLVYQFYPGISADYDWLMDLCLKARYQNYQQGENEAKKSIELLNKIVSELKIP